MEIKIEAMTPSDWPMVRSIYGSSAESVGAEAEAESALRKKNWP
jgi:hypothetical protein